MSELEDVKAERDALGRMLHDKAMKLQRAIEQRDRIRAALESMMADYEYVDFCDEQELEADECMISARRALKEIDDERT